MVVCFGASSNNAHAYRLSVIGFFIADGDVLLFLLEEKVVDNSKGV